MKLVAIQLLFAVCNGLLTERQSCLNPATRTEWRDLADSEKSAYIEAVQCLKSIESRLSGTDDDSLYDDFAYVHRQLDTQIHSVAVFLPWHRWFVYVYESALQDECGYNGTLPYWDWTLDYEDPASSPVFDTDLGFGGNGEEGSGCVIDGPFAGLNLSTPDDHCLQRVFNLDMIPLYASPSQVNSTLETISYSLFRPALESGPHRGAHAGISGDMGHNYSPNDPIFFLHHGNIDRIWWQWQSVDSSRRSDYAGNRYRNNATVEGTLEDPVPMVSGFFDEAYTVGDLMWVETGVFCYTY